MGVDVGVGVGVFICIIIYLVANNNALLQAILAAANCVYTCIIIPHFSFYTLMCVSRWRHTLSCSLFTFFQCLIVFLLVMQLVGELEFFSYVVYTCRDACVYVDEPSHSIHHQFYRHYS